MGANTKASGSGSTAMGTGTRASGNNSTAMGANITASGQTSTAMGGGTSAGGLLSTAMGDATVASGQTSAAMGAGTSASGTSSTVMGNVTVASGQISTAMGYFTQASGSNSTAMGSFVSTNGHMRGFIIGDASTSHVDVVDRDNEFCARFAGGFALGSDAAFSVGVELKPSANSWSLISDSTKKENFRPVDGEELLAKLRHFRLGTWNYKGQGPASYRHYGPMAQEFHAAFGHDGIGLAGDDTSINQADFDGINMTAI